VTGYAMRCDVALRFALLAIQAAKLIESNEKMDVFGELLHSNSSEVSPLEFLKTYFIFF